MCDVKFLSKNPLDSAPGGNSYHHFRQDLVRASHGGDSVSITYGVSKNAGSNRILSTKFLFLCEKNILSMGEIMEEFSLLLMFLL